jgi:D-inositol-3-phosphate glycosyltransferase
MNVYIRALASSLARAGVAVDVFTRAEHPEQQPVVVVEPGFRVLHVPAGACAPVPRHALPDLVGPFTDGVRELIERAGYVPEQETGCAPYDVLHANYWVSGAVGHKLKHELDLPLVTTFHTLERVKAEVGMASDAALRPRIEAEVVRCADLVVASTEEEREQLVCFYGADPDRVEVVAPGVDHLMFSPGDRGAARRELGLRDRPLLLFVGRIQRLKGADLAIGALAEMHDPHAELVIVGGPSGPDGEAELAHLHALVDELGLEARVRFVAPQPHERLVAWYRAADVCVVPSQAESFGLVALEAAACGTPVVASDVGGLRSLVDHGRTGYLVARRDPADFARAVERVLTGNTVALRAGAIARASRYRWNIAAARLRRHYDDLGAREPVQCS